MKPFRRYSIEIIKRILTISGRGARNTSIERIEEQSLGGKKEIC